MTTTSETNEHQRNRTLDRPLTMPGRLRQVDLNSGQAVFNALGADRSLHFGRELGPEVQALEGQDVEALGIPTFNGDDKLIRIDLEAIRRKPTPEERGRADWKPLNPNPPQHASFDFDVDEFLRGIYEARWGGSCTRADFDFSWAGGSAKPDRPNTEA